MMAYSQYIREAVVDHVRQGASQQAAAAHYGISSVTIGKWCRGAGLQFPNGRRSALSREIRERIATLYAEGRSAGELMKEFGVTRGVIRHVVRKAGIPAHHRHETSLQTSGEAPRIAISFGASDMRRWREIAAHEGRSIAAVIRDAALRGRAA